MRPNHLPLESTFTSDADYFPFGKYLGPLGDHLWQKPNLTAKIKVSITTDASGSVCACFRTSHSSHPCRQYKYLMRANENTMIVSDEVVLVPYRFVRLAYGMILECSFSEFVLGKNTSLSVLPLRSVACCGH